MGGVNQLRRWCGINGYVPGSHFEAGIQVPEICLLEGLAREGGTQGKRTVIDVVFGPESESGLEKGETRIVVVFFRERTVKVKVELLQLRI